MSAKVNNSVYRRVLITSKTAKMIWLLHKSNFKELTQFQLAGGAVSQAAGFSPRDNGPTDVFLWASLLQEGGK